MFLVILWLILTPVVAFVTMRVCMARAVRSANAAHRITRTFWLLFALSTVVPVAEWVLAGYLFGGASLLFPATVIVSMVGAIGAMGTVPRI